MTSHEEVGTISLGRTRSLQDENVLQPRKPSIDDFHCENGQQEKEFSFAKPADGGTGHGKENAGSNRHGLRGTTTRRRAASLGGNWGGLSEKFCWQANELQNENGSVGGRPPRRSSYGGRRKVVESLSCTDLDRPKTLYGMQQRKPGWKKPESKYKRVERGYRDMEHGVTWVVDEQTWRMLGSMQGVATSGSVWKDVDTHDVDTCANCGDSGFENWLGCQTRTFDVSDESEQACSEEGDGSSYRNLDSLENFVDILSDTHREPKNLERYAGSLSGTHQSNHVASGRDSTTAKQEKLRDAGDVGLVRSMSARGLLEKTPHGGKTHPSNLSDFQKKNAAPTKKSTLFSEFFPKKVTSFGRSMLNQKSVFSRAGLTGVRGIVVSIFHIVCVSMIKRGK
ncbi:hypothetical protein BSKO_09904 [Bryopsis sp. KO-2023]|nr:hypothetical protein BSKO_09904 [Bryopsis sp. KO-2023]